MRRRVLIVAALLVVAGVAASGAWGAGGTGASAPVVERQEAPENTTTAVRHRNPESVFERGDLGAVSSYLANRLSELLGASAVQLSQGEYEAARSVVGDQYDEVLEKYVDVAGETDRDENPDRFERAQRQQREFVESVAEYNETREAYEDAREAGNDTRARALARRLQRLADRVNATGTGLNRTYRRIETSEGVETDPYRDVVVTLQNATLADRREVQEEAFVRTEVTVLRATERIAFDDPLILSGRIDAANGTAVANRTARFRIGERVREAQTNATGGFTLRYRPVRLGVDADTVTLRYRPENRSIYLGNETTVPVTVEAVTPTLAVGDASARVGYGDPVEASGQVTVDGRAVPDVPVVLRIGETTIASTTTDADGGYVLRDSLPASAAPGSRSATVAVDMTDRAIAGIEEPVALTVTQTATELDVSANASTESVDVSGTLETEAGTPVASQSVDLRVDGTLAASVTTDVEGQFGTTLEVPAGAADRVRVLAVYEDPATNLESSQARVVAAIPEGPGPDEGLFPIAGLSREWVIGIGAAAIGLLVLGGAVYARRRGGAAPATGDAVVEAPTPDEPSPPPGAALLDRAGAHQAAGAGREAVEAAYGAARQTLVADGLPATGTHWEFYQAARTGSRDEASVEALETLTTTYERAAFSDEPVKAGEAEAALAAARTIVDGAELAAAG